jgi:hypothetical protein
MESVTRVADVRANLGLPPQMGRPFRTRARDRKREGNSPVETEQGADLAGIGLAGGSPAHGWTQASRRGSRFSPAMVGGLLGDVRTCGIGGGSP